MNDQRFDALTTAFAAALPRRRLLRLLGAAGAAGFLGRLVGRGDVAAAAPSRFGLLATFDVLGEPLHVWAITPEAIQQLRALKSGESTTSIPIGRLQRGSGVARHNAPWHWHLDPNTVQLADFTTEVCDGLPSYVEAHLAEFVDNVRYFCPWSAVLVDLQPFRPFKFNQSR